MEGFIPVKLNPATSRVQLANKTKTPFLEVGDLQTYLQVERGENIEHRSFKRKAKTV